MSSNLILCIAYCQSRQTTVVAFNHHTNLKCHSLISDDDAMLTDAQYRPGVRRHSNRVCIPWCNTVAISSQVCHSSLVSIYSVIATKWQ